MSKWLGLYDYSGNKVYKGDNVIYTDLVWGTVVEGKIRIVSGISRLDQDRIIVSGVEIIDFNPRGLKIIVDNDE